MNIALFGGTFDPIHSGHLRAARAAARRLQLDRVLFIPSRRPPHKISNHLTDFPHRYAMVALACAGEPRFIPSLLEAPTSDGSPRYSVYTARAVKHTLGPKDRLFFLIGVDALLDLQHWRDYRDLLNLVNFVVVTRPGFDAHKIWEVLPGDMTAPDHRPGQTVASLSTEGQSSLREAGNLRKSETLQLPQTVLHILSGVHAPIASRDIRQAVFAGRPIHGLVPVLVAKYIAKERLYRRKAESRRQ